MREKREQREGEGDRRREKQRVEGGEKISWGERRIEDEERKEERKKRALQANIKVAFWNVAGLGNKMGDFCSKLKNWDVMVLVETWVEEKN